MELLQVLSVPHQKSHSNGLAVSRVSIKRIYQSYRVICRVALLPSELFIIFIACVFFFLELYLSLQFFEYHSLVLVRLYLKIHVISERLWKIQSGRFHESHHVELTVPVISLFLLGLLLMVSGFLCCFCQLVVITFLLFKVLGLLGP